MMLFNKITIRIHSNGIDVNSFELLKKHVSGSPAPTPDRALGSGPGAPAPIALLALGGVGWDQVWVVSGGIEVWASYAGSYYTDCIISLDAGALPGPTKN